MGSPLTRRGKPDTIYLARITTVEVTSAVARRRRSGSLTSRRASSILGRFRHHIAGRYLVAEITPDLLTVAARLANLHGLRAYDAVQLAAVTELNHRPPGRRWVQQSAESPTKTAEDREAMPLVASVTRFDVIARGAPANQPNQGFSTHSDVLQVAAWKAGDFRSQNGTLNRRWQSAGLGGVTLVSADRELNTAASMEGLTVEDPNSHP